MEIMVGQLTSDCTEHDWKYCIFTLVLSAKCRKKWIKKFESRIEIRLADHVSIPILRVWYKFTRKIRMSERRNQFTDCTDHCMIQPRFTSHTTTCLLHLPATILHFSPDQELRLNTWQNGRSIPCMGFEDGALPWAAHPFSVCSLQRIFSKIFFWLSRHSVCCTLQMQKRQVPNCTNSGVFVSEGCHISFTISSVLENIQGDF